MALRTRIPVYARRAALLGALGALLAPATAGAATAHASKKAKKYPVITSVSPMQTNIGKTLTIKGRNFKRGRNKNTVLFKRDGARAVFVKADIGTAKLLKVKLPAKLAAVLKQVNGSASMTTFRLRVLSNRLSKSFTTLRRSPKIGPELPPAPPKIEDQSVTNPEGDCDGDGAKNGVDGDDDNDLLPDGDEMNLKLDPCKADTDGDAVEDGYELRSARDWNDDEYQAANGYLPYPDKRPYPNALDADAGVDHDGDTLTLKEEFDLWKYTISQGSSRSLDSLTYSAGEQYSVHNRDGSGRRVPALAADGYPKQDDDFLKWAAREGYATVMLADPGASWFASRTSYDIRDFNRSGGAPTTVPVGGSETAEATYYDLNYDGKLSDDERDEDADGLTNFDETRGCMNRNHWDKLYSKESPYYLAYSGTRHDDDDTDGDLVRDGADDADHDDLPNMMECSRNLVSNLPFDPRPAVADPPASRLAMPEVKGFVNPFNPCLPSPTSRSCNQHPSLDSPWAPFKAEDKYWYVWN